MRRTPTLQAAAAALGLMAGLAMTPADRAPLERSLTPHAVAFAWRAGGGPERAVAGVELDDQGNHVTPAPPPAERRARAKPERARGSGVRAEPAGKPAPASRVEVRSRRELVVRDMDRATATFGVHRNECPRHARGS